MAIIDKLTCRRLGIELLKEGKCHELYIVTFRADSVRDYLALLKSKDIDRYDKLWARLKRISDTHRHTWNKSIFKQLKGRHLRGKICEIISSKDRVFFFFEKKNCLILTNGFKKQGYKTPATQIAKADRIRKEYLMKRVEVENENR